MEHLVWPLAVLLISALFMQIFKAPLKDLFKRFRGVTKDGASVSFGEPEAGADDLQKREAALEARIRTAYQQEIAEIRSKIVEQQQHNADTRAELLRFQKNIGYKKGQLTA